MVVMTTESSPWLTSWKQRGKQCLISNTLIALLIWVVWHYYHQSNSCRYYILIKPYRIWSVPVKPRTTCDVRVRHCCLEHLAGEILPGFVWWPSVGWAVPDKMAWKQGTISSTTPSNPTYTGKEQVSVHIALLRLYNDIKTLLLHQTQPTQGRNTSCGSNDL